MKKFGMLALILLTSLTLGGNPLYADALTPNVTYTITIQKMNSNGTVSDYSSTTAIADANGKLSFTLSSMPTNTQANFLVIIIKDGNDNVVRKGFVPAPPAGSTNLVGVNNLSTAQTNAVLRAGETIGTDDPIPVAYLLTLLRSEGTTANDAILLAQIGRNAILGTGGFEDFLTSNGVSAEKLTHFRSYLIYNPTAGKKSIADLSASFKTAVDSGDATTAKQEMQKAGGFMADVFMDAAEAAGIDFSLILAAHDAAGVVVQGGETLGLMTQLSSGLQKSMDQSMSSFHQRIAAVKVKSEYTKALNTLNASGTQVNTFTSCVATMMTAMSEIDSQYADYYNDPDSYLSAHPGTTAGDVQNAMGALYQTAFTDFQTCIASSNPDIAAMKTSVATAFALNPSDLPPDFGTYYDFTGTQKNWPIPQTVMVKWMATLIGAGGSFSYTRDQTPIPTFMMWLGTCDNPSYYDQGSCASNSGTWTQGRHDYTQPPYGSPNAAFNAYLGLQEDIQIVEGARNSIYQGSQPTKAEEETAKLLFAQRLENVALNLILGTIDGTTPLSSEQKRAIVRLLMQPSMD